MLLSICKSYSHFFSKNTCELDIVLTRTLNILTTNNLVKLTMLWTTGPRDINYTELQLSLYRGAGHPSCPLLPLPHPSAYSSWFLPCFNTRHITLHFGSTGNVSQPPNCTNTSWSEDKIDSEPQYEFILKWIYQKNHIFNKVSISLCI